MILTIVPVVIRRLRGPWTASIGTPPWTCRKTDVICSTEKALLLHGILLARQGLIMPRPLTLSLA